MLNGINAKVETLELSTTFGNLERHCSPISSSNITSPGPCRALQVLLTHNTPPSARLHPELFPPTRTAVWIDADYASASFAHWILSGLRREQRHRVPATLKMTARCVEG